MFQDGVLFPHRDVAGDIAYGLRFTGLDRDESRVDRGVSDESRDPLVGRTARRRTPGSRCDPRRWWRTRRVRCMAGC